MQRMPRIEVDLGLAKIVSRRACLPARRKPMGRVCGGRMPMLASPATAQHAPKVSSSAQPAPKVPPSAQPAPKVSSSAQPAPKVPPSAQTAPQGVAISAACSSRPRPDVKGDGSSASPRPRCRVPRGATPVMGGAACPPPRHRAPGDACLRPADACPPALRSPPVNARGCAESG